MKQIDVGGLSFKELREGNRYYVDKTMLLADILGSNDRGVYLYTRPPRFGKSVNLSMLDAFFNIEYRGNDWFDGLEISDHHEYDRYRNEFPVIYMDMGPCRGPSFDRFISTFRKVVDDAWDRHRYLLGSETLDPHLTRLFRDRGDTSQCDLILSVRTLSEALTEYHGVKPVILIDGYDSAVANLRRDSEYASIVEFLSSFFHVTVKCNENRQLVYMTGVVPFTRGGILSGSDNIHSDDVFLTRSDDRFGFTESEVRDILTYYGRPDDLGEMMERYGGHRFGDAIVHNPYAVMCYVSNGSGSDVAADVVMDWFLDKVCTSALQEVMSLIDGDTIEVWLDTYMSNGDPKDSFDSLYALMAVFGYLNAVSKDEERFEVSVPNREVMAIMDKRMKGLHLTDGGTGEGWDCGVER